MPTSRARALLLATHSRSIPRAVAVAGPRHAHRSEYRTFSTSKRRLARPDDTNTTNGGKYGSENRDTKEDISPVGDEGSATGQPSSTPGLEAYKETLRERGYGSARVRALRGKTVEEAPLFSIPEWFACQNVQLLDSSNIVRPNNAYLLQRRVAQLPRVEVADVDAAVRNAGSGGLEDLSRRLQDMQIPFRAPSPQEHIAYQELLAAARTEITAIPPLSSSSKRLNRPVTVLSLLNCKGSTFAKHLVRDLGSELGADVVHLDAPTLAQVLGEYLGQTQHWERSTISMLGYAAAEMNGRLLSRLGSDIDPDDVTGDLFITLPSRIRAMSRRESFLPGTSSDERWEDIKISRVLEALVQSADAQRRQEGSCSNQKNLVIHIHNYLELSSISETIISKLRSIVDRMWQSGRRVIIIGSTSSSPDTARQWRMLLRSSKDDCHLVPFHVNLESQKRQRIEQNDAIEENLHNISSMLRTLGGKAVGVSWTPSDSWQLSAADQEQFTPDLRSILGKGVYDVQWVYRLVTLILGKDVPSPHPREFGLRHLREALAEMTAVDKQWADKYSAAPPYYSPLFSTSTSNEPFTSIDPQTSGEANASASNNYDKYEKKLLSGLINSKDIRTTFDDIVVPESTKESLIALTSLSLVQPEAFSYGVLKTERIPGCLLYGPPGTGKTLLAKAVAKESGANMLEVSAASINDMYVGQSEKNVRALFSLARKLAPAVIFLDEADALLRSRRGSHHRVAHRETITQFLREWDGLTDMRAFIMVATNRPFDLDEAVLRRLPRKMLVDLPLRAEREAILRVILRDEILDEESVSISRLAEETDLYSGSDLKNMCVSAAMHAVREEMRAKKQASAAGQNTGTTAACSDGTSAADPSGSDRAPQPLPRRVLTRAHFDKALAEISASISDDMESLKAIRKFDEQYGDGGRQRRRRRNAMGFEVGPKLVGSEEARVRKPLLA
ncbi:hypothetical protein VTK73DRAFT_128 [Phialemonium thermophilum]|uniref:AAA+ ATPase domain-containing protein n=1 Tax=Phialemonium thermophilum TaxID=223376 RepID=A0ABR3Y4S0_9PEZI